MPNLVREALFEKEKDQILPGQRTCTLGFVDDGKLRILVYNLHSHPLYSPDLASLDSVPKPENFYYC